MAREIIDTINRNMPVQPEKKEEPEKVNFLQLNSKEMRKECKCYLI